MPANKKTSKLNSRARKAPARKSAHVKKRTTRRGSSFSSQLGKTATEMLAGAAAGAVRALIPPLEETVRTTEVKAGSHKQGKQKRAASAR